MRTVAICGSAMTSRHLVMQLAERPEVEVWGMNQLWQWFPRDASGRLRADLWFEIHRATDWASYEPRELEELSKLTIPVLLQDLHPQIPMGRKYPLDTITAAWGDYLTSSVCFQLGYAVYDHTALGHPIDRLELLGVDCSTALEYVEQRGATEYWLGILAGLIGRKHILIPEGCPLLKGVLYGYSPHQPVTVDRLTDRYNELLDQRDQVIATLERYNGARLALIDIGAEDSDAPEIQRRALAEAKRRLNEERKLILAVNGGLQLMESLLAEAGAPVRNPTVPPPEPRVPSAVADDGHRPDNLILFEGVQHG